ncbi:hypothetical protein BW39_01891 [Delftia sp. RIT313]|nr:hypothetical protein BW39_01891 [Delftia sp. RIT313]
MQYFLDYFNRSFWRWESLKIKLKLYLITANQMQILDILNIILFLNQIFMQRP